MHRKQNIFESEYIIDGLKEGLTPAKLLQPFCIPLPGKGSRPVPDGDPSCPSRYEPVVDESLDPGPAVAEYVSSEIGGYLSELRKTRREFPLFFAGAYTYLKMARALVDVLWNRGHFRFEDLSLKALWRWNDAEIGNMAAFYDSVMQAADCLDALSMRLSSYRAQMVQGPLDVAFKVDAGAADSLDGEFLAAMPDPEPGVYEVVFDEEPVREVRLGVTRICPRRLVSDPDSWIVFIPFDTADFNLGGSLLNQALGVSGGGRAPELSDPQYFKDCFEVVREFVEDGILLSAASVGEGGLITALDSMTSERVGVVADVSDLLRAYPGNDLVHVLFSEIPGAVIQIRDQDYDYVDAELLLQDVAFFPLGHPGTSSRKVEICSSGNPGIQNILESLISR